MKESIKSYNNKKWIMNTLENTLSKVIMKEDKVLCRIKEF